MTHVLDSDDKAEDESDQVVPPVEAPAELLIGDDEDIDPRAG